MSIMEGEIDKPTERCKCGKLCYQKADANRAANRLSQKGPRFTFYKCKISGAYHLAHRESRARRGARFVLKRLR